MTTEKPKTTVKKAKLVRDSFTIPKTEYAAIDGLKTRAVGLGAAVKKSELLRAGLMALQALNDAAFKRALAAVPTLKTGRPATEVATAPTPAPTPTPRPARPAVKKPAIKKTVAAQPVAQKAAVAQPPAKKAISRVVKAVQPAAKARVAVALPKTSVSTVPDKASAHI